MFPILEKCYKTKYQVNFPCLCNSLETEEDLHIQLISVLSCFLKTNWHKTSTSNGQIKLPYETGDTNLESYMM